jgi:predicted Fe-S protein YdhL (DUF1289 family)
MELSPSPAPAIETPCIKLCIVDGESGLCMGCYRSLPEVGRWGRMSPDERTAIITSLPDRRARIRPEKLAMFHSN